LHNNLNSAWLSTCVEADSLSDTYETVEIKVARNLRATPFVIQNVQKLESKTIPSSLDEFLSRQSREIRKLKTVEDERRTVMRFLIESKPSPKS
jgi:low affinity Fe/Cu permease